MLTYLSVVVGIALIWGLLRLPVALADGAHKRDELSFILADMAIIVGIPLVIPLAVIYGVYVIFKERVYGT